MSVRSKASALTNFGRDWICHVVSLYRVRWVLVAAVAVAGAVALVAWMVAYGLCGERMVRLGGMLAQLLGFGIVAYGILSKIKLFRNHGLWRPLADWWERRPRLCRRIDLAGHATVNTTMSGHLTSSLIRVEPDAPLDKRITAVEKNVDMLFNEIGDLGTQVRTNATTATAAIRGEQSKRETEYANAQRQLDEHHECVHVLHDRLQDGTRQRRIPKVRR